MNSIKRRDFLAGISGLTMYSMFGLFSGKSHNDVLKNTDRDRMIALATNRQISEIEKKVNSLIKKMTLKEKIGQMTQRQVSAETEDAIRQGKIGSILNEVNTTTLNRIQRIAIEENRLGIPLIFGRDVIHGFRTIFPIPLGQAATWNPQLVEQGARIAAIEAASVGIHWTFSPMVDITHDPRWGRIAECFGEDALLTSVLAAAIIRGYQSDDLSKKDAIAACTKHFAGYGAVEGGRDYNTVYLPEQLFRQVYLKPFEACVEADVATIMTAFIDLNGIPISGNSFLLRQILRNEWQYKGMVVSDWASITEMVIHGFCADNKNAAEKAITAGIDMEMATDTYQKYIKMLIDEGKLSMHLVNDAVRRILTLKYKLGLFERPYTDSSQFPPLVNSHHLEVARKSAQQSIVMLKNNRNILPLTGDIKQIAVFGPLADDKYEQLGIWTFDKNIKDTQTPLQALRKYIGNSAQIHFEKVLETTRSHDTRDFKSAIKLAKQSDVILLFLGEEAFLSGEARCRANIDLPGAQEQLIHTLNRTGKPIVLIIMSGRPLTLGKIIDKVDAILFVFHPGTMGGPAIVDILMGKETPSGKLPVTFPKVVGQIPIYYNHKNTGRPPDEKLWTHIDDLSVRGSQSSCGFESHYIDAGFKPQFPFGYGLSYTRFEYDDLRLSSSKVKIGNSIKVSAVIKNCGSVEAEEIVQLYTRDVTASITPSVKELKNFQRIRLKPGELQIVEFVLHTADLAFYNQQMEQCTEPGKFNVWIAKNSEEGLMGKFEVVV